jgi:hypothetical protein
MPVAKSIKSGELTARKYTLGLLLSQCILARRLAGHVDSFKRHQAGKKPGCCSSHKLIDRPVYQVILVEAFPCTTKDELHAREQHWVNQIPNTVNKMKAYTGLTKSEYNAQYNVQNREKRTATQRVYARQKINCGCGLTHRKDDTTAHAKTRKHQQWLATQQ